ncbi:MAG: DUF929 family protein [Nitrososphaerota archaeon]|jgi:hypothetical protein|nr:DUF929 family protein [Nitrososphaerota archaeon]MDG6950482.1 DUF929 family protein [Nitrososphaerota archaeon]
MWISIAAVMVALLVVVYFIAAASSDPYTKYIGEPVSSTIIQQITGVSDSTLNAIGTPSGVSAPVTISGSALTSGGKPEVLYIGGEFCPFCAIERWAIIVALSHFGKFTGLEYMLSSSTDVNPNTPTFTFAHANYTSGYISFVAVEEYGRAGTSDVRQTLTSAQTSLVAQYDTCSATGTTGGIPFIDIANQYAVNCGAQFQLPAIAGGNWSQVASVLNDPSSSYAQLIDGAANYLISAICNVDGGQPGSVCGQGYATATLSYSQTSSLTSTSLFTVPVRNSNPRWTV